MNADARMALQIERDDAEWNAWLFRLGRAIVDRDPIMFVRVYSSRFSSFPGQSQQQTINPLGSI